MAGGTPPAVNAPEGGHEPRFTRLFRYPRAMPQYEVGHLDRVAAIEGAVTRLGGLAVTGAAYRGVGIPDCIHGGEEAAERLVASIRGASR